MIAWQLLSEHFACAQYYSNRMIAWQLLSEHFVCAQYYSLDVWMQRVLFRFGAKCLTCGTALLLCVASVLRYVYIYTYIREAMQYQTYVSTPILTKTIATQTKMGKQIQLVGNLLVTKRNTQLKKKLNTTMLLKFCFKS
jgi:hypothetical protein